MTRPAVRGFTLVELLVVIAIVAILVAVLAPVLARAREQGRAAACSAHPKQLAAATQLYTDDYDGVYAPQFYMEESAGSRVGVTVYDLHLPYLKSTGLLQCPSRPRAIDWPALTSHCGMPFRPSGKWTYASYGGNLAVFVQGVEDPYFNGAVGPVVNETELPYPAETPLWFDGLLDCQFISPVEGRHNERVNAAYADGHAGSVKADFIKGGGQWFVTGGLYSGSNSLWGIVQADRTVSALGRR